jgi:hypothetical protein
MSNALLIFDVHGPFPVPLQKERNGCFIERNCPAFWRQHQHYANKFGCYVFALKAGRGVKPIYVGKTANRFDRECFTSDKIAGHYTPALARKGKGTPVLFLLIPEMRKGKPNGKVIDDLETFLIQVGAAKNPELSNIQHKKEARWGIRGVIRYGKGKPSSGAQQFRRGMRIS